MWPIVRRFGLIALAIVALWLVSVLTLNLTVYSPSGHVSRYLTALEKGDYGLAAATAGLAEVPGVLPENGQLKNPRITGSGALDTGDIIVRAEYELGDDTEETVFILREDEPILVFFTTWQFVRPPLAQLDLSVLGDNRIEINGGELALNRLGVPPRTSVFAPGHYSASWETQWLTSNETSVTVTEVGSRNPVRLVIEPTDQLIDRTKDAVEDYLDDCADQGVLQPVGCPFGITITDRIVGVPQWTILDYPDVTLRLGADRSTWSVTASKGLVDVTVQVQSLFDGTIEQTQETIEFRMLGVVRGTGVDEPVLNLY
jgi:hypothetical protein